MKKILLIDSDVLFLEDLGRTLTLMGLDVRYAETGFEGIELINKETFDFVITNLFIPFFNGNDVARHVRLVQKKQVRIIGMSEKPWLFNEEEFDRIISKLLSTADLAQIIKEYTAPLRVVPAKVKKTKVGSLPPSLEDTIEIAAVSS